MKIAKKHQIYWHLLFSLRSIIQTKFLSKKSIFSFIDLSIFNQNDFFFNHHFTKSRLFSMIFFIFQFSINQTYDSFTLKLFTTIVTWWFVNFEMNVFFWFDVFEFCFFFSNQKWIQMNQIFFNVAFRRRKIRWNTINKKNIRWTLLKI